MNNFFNTDQLMNFLFKNWTPNTAGLVGTCIFIAALTVVLEGLNYLKVILRRKGQVNPIQPDMSASTERSPLLAPLLIPSSVQAMKRHKLGYHILQTLVHVGHLVLGYVVMLAVMSYNVYIGISVVVAAGIGYFFFGALRNIILEEEQLAVMKNTTRQTTDVST